jgi:hypothetical protein
MNSTLVRRFYGPAGRALVGTGVPAACDYQPWTEFSHRHYLHDHVPRRWLPFLRQCVPSPPCDEPAVACVWWDSPHAGYYEAPVCARHHALAAEQHLLVPIERGVEREPDGKWVVLPGAKFEESG